jgi:hypothetical protein
VLAEYALRAQEDASLRNRITNVRRAIRKDVLMRYPQLQARTTDAYVDMITGRLPEIRGAIMNHARYGELDALFREEEESAARLLDSERRLAQVEKVFRLRQLAKTEDYLARFGAQSDRTGYARLVRCEDTAL